MYLCDGTARGFNSNPTQPNLRPTGSASLNWVDPAMLLRLEMSPGFSTQCQQSLFLFRAYYILYKTSHLLFSYNKQADVKDVSSLRINTDTMKDVLHEGKVNRNHTLEVCTSSQDGSDGRLSDQREWLQDVLMK